MKSNPANEKFFLQLIHRGLLKVTKSGRAWNVHTGKELAKQRDGRSGVYRKLSWQHPKTKKIMQVQLHRIVWAKYKGIPKDTYLELNHLDGNKQNCCLSNLELGTSAGNNLHALNNGLVYIPRGDDKPNAKFTDAEVRKYRRQFANNKLKRSVLAKKLNTSIGVVTGMLKGKMYGHVVTEYDTQCKELCAS